MPDEAVRLLDTRDARGGHHHRDVAERGQAGAARAGEADHDAPGPPRGHDGGEDVRGAAARADAHQHVALARQRLHLTREHLLVAVVVGERGEERAGPAEGDGGEAAALALEAADEFRRDVLGIGGAAVVAAEEEPPARDDGGDDPPARVLDDGPALLDQRADDGLVLGEITRDQLTGRAALGRPAADAGHERARRVAGHERQRVDLAAAPENTFGADDLLGGPVATLHEDVGLELGDEPRGRRLVEDDHVVDRS